MEAVSLASSSHRVYSLKDNVPRNRNSAKKILWHWKQQDNAITRDGHVDFSSTIHNLSAHKSPHVANEFFLEMKSQGLLPCCNTLSALMLCYAHNGLFSHAQAIWEEIIYSSCVPKPDLVSQLMDAYAEMGLFDEVVRILHDVVCRDLGMGSQAYSAAISCFGKTGQLQMMEDTLEEMISSGFRVDSATGDALLRGYSMYGSISDVEVVYGRLKRSRVLIEEEGIRAVASAYINKKLFYKLGEFVRDVGLGRRNHGNLLWNFLLLSYAGNFKMKSMQREFVRMAEAGFSPDLTTFNIRALAFSKMSLFWDINVTIEHMRHEQVLPDLVTYGCVVDMFLDRRLGRNLNFALNKMNVNNYPLVLTDHLVFEVFGKGGFHSSSEALLEYKISRKLTYRELIKIYLKKKYRSTRYFGIIKYCVSICKFRFRKEVSNPLRWKLPNVF